MFIIYLDIYVVLCICISICISISICICICICICLYLYLHVYIYIYTYLLTCVCIYVYVCIYMYPHVLLARAHCPWPMPSNRNPQRPGTGKPWDAPLGPLRGPLDVSGHLMWTFREGRHSAHLGCPLLLPTPSGTREAPLGTPCGFRELHPLLRYATLRFSIRFRCQLALLFISPCFTSNFKSN